MQGAAQQKIIRGLRLRLFRAILRQDIAFFDTTQSGEIASRLTADCAEMANDLTWVFRFTIEALVRDDGFGVITGSTTIAWEDFGVTPPSAPIVVSIDESGIIEFQLIVAKG
mgnify:CR=1 FL=1